MTRFWDFFSTVWEINFPPYGNTVHDFNILLFACHYCTSTCHTEFFKDFVQHFLAMSVLATVQVSMSLEMRNIVPGSLDPTNYSKSLTKQKLDVISRGNFFVLFLKSLLKLIYKMKSMRLY